MVSLVVKPAKKRDDGAVYELHCRGEGSAEQCEYCDKSRKMYDDRVAMCYHRAGLTKRAAKSLMEPGNALPRCSAEKSFVYAGQVRFDIENRSKDERRPLIDIGPEDEEEIHLFK